MNEESFKERNRKIWKKSNQALILNSVGFLSIPWLILKGLFLNKKRPTKYKEESQVSDQVKRYMEKEKRLDYV